MYRYVVWLVAFVGLVIILILLLFHGGSKPATPKSLESYANSSAVARLTIDGPEISSQQHQSVQIDVNNTAVTYELINGYNGQITNLKTYPNTEASYYVFLRAIDGAGFTKGNTSEESVDDSGYCPLGDRYVVELVYGSSDVERFWSTSCGGLGTYSGDLDLTLTLFQDQVPNYSSLTENANI